MPANGRWDLIRRLKFKLLILPVLLKQTVAFTLNIYIFCVFICVNQSRLSGRNSLVTLHFTVYFPIHLQRLKPVKLTC